MFGSDSVRDSPEAARSKSPRQRAVSTIWRRRYIALRERTSTSAASSAIVISSESPTLSLMMSSKRLKSLTKSNAQLETVVGAGQKIPANAESQSRVRRKPVQVIGRIRDRLVESDV